MTESSGRELVPARPRRALGVRGWLVALTFALLLWAVLAGPAATLGRHLGLTSTPRRYTELYFTQPASLPAVATAGSSVRLSVGLHSHEARTLTYRWRATVMTGTGPVPLAAGRVRVRPGEQVAVDVAGAWPATVGPARLEVALDGRAEHVGFPVTIAGP